MGAEALICLSLNSKPKDVDSQVLKLFFSANKINFQAFEVSAGRPSLFFVLISQRSMQSTLLETVKNLAEPIVEQEGMFLVDVEVKGAGTPEIWVLVDTEEGGVNVDKCSQISRKLGLLLEEEDLISKAYRLNVSSPGLSRPLSDRRQYGKNQGRTAKVKYKKGDEYLTEEGVLLSANGEQIQLKIDESRTITITFDEIVETKIIPKI
jgi:ribosome maturation factor RimP